MEPLNLDYGPLRAAIARGDVASIEAHARKLRDKHIADFVRNAAIGCRTVIAAIGRRARTQTALSHSHSSQPALFEE